MWIGISRMGTWGLHEVFNYKILRWPIQTKSQKTKTHMECPCSFRQFHCKLSLQDPSSNNFGTSWCSKNCSISSHHPVSAMKTIKNRKQVMSSLDLAWRFPIHGVPQIILRENQTMTTRIETTMVTTGGPPWLKKPPICSTQMSLAMWMEVRLGAGWGGWCDTMVDVVLFKLYILYKNCIWERQTGVVLGQSDP